MMKTVKVKIHCLICGKFEVEHEVDINKFGYFTFPQAFCPECLSILDQIINGEEKQCQK